MKSNPKSMRGASRLARGERAATYIQFFGFISSANRAGCAIPELLGRHFRRRAHHQILGALVHREQHHLAQILLAGEQHDDAVDAGRDAAMRRRAERERVQHAAEFLLQHFLRIAGDGEGLLHHLGAMITDGAGRQFDAVADDVVLDRLNRQRILSSSLGIEREEFIDVALFGIENGLCEKSIFFSSSFHSYIGKFDDPAQLETVLFDQAQFFANSWCAPSQRT